MPLKEIIVISIVLLLVSLIDLLRNRRFHQTFGVRYCAGVRWRRRFSHASADEIRDFLKLLSQSFLINRAYQLKFRPDDRVIDMYKAAIWPGGIALEVEDFAEELECQYGIQFEPFWKDDITLGEIFQLTRPA